MYTVLGFSSVRRVNTARWSPPTLLKISLSSKGASHIHAAWHLTHYVSCRMRRLLPLTSLEHDVFQSQDEQKA